MSGAIRFDDDRLLFTEEVDDEGPERLLPTKLGALELSSTQAAPELTLRWGLGATERTRAKCQRTDEARHPHVSAARRESCLYRSAPLSLRERGWG